jgi:hypothetical protein
MAVRRPGELQVGFRGATAIRLLAQGDWSSADADIGVGWALRGLNKMNKGAVYSR